MKLRLNLVLLLLLALTGCFSSRFEQKPKLDGQELLGSEKTEFLNRLAQLDLQTQTLKALALTEISDGSERAKLRYAFVLERPNSLRLEVLPTNAVYALSLLVSNAQGFTLLDTTEKRAYQGKDAAEALRDLLRVPLQPNDLISFLSAHVPARFLNLKTQSQLKVYFDAQSQSYALVMGDFDYYWLLDAATLSLRQMQVRDPNSNGLKLEASFNSASPGIVASPKQIQLNLVRDGVSAHLKFSLFSTNDSIPPQRFELVIPSDYTLSSRYLN